MNKSINVAASQTDSPVVSPTPGKRIAVQSVFCMAGGTATNVTFNSKGSGAGTAISPLLTNPINGHVTLPYSSKGWFQTNAGESLTVTTGAGSSTSIIVEYEYID